MGMPAAGLGTDLCPVMVTRSSCWVREAKCDAMAAPSAARPCGVSTSALSAREAALQLLSFP
jgi:hypothetical protein